MDASNEGPELATQHETLKVPSLLDIRWNRQYQQLLNIFQVKGPCDIPLSFTVTAEDGQVYKLGCWLGTQRRLYKKNALPEHKKEKLQVFINFLW